MAVLALFGLVAGLVGEGVHGLVVAHVYCAAHATVEHVDPDHGVAAHEAGRAVGETTGVHLRASSEAGGDHVACSIEIGRREEAVALPGEVLRTGELDAVRVRTVARAEEPAPRVAAYRLAPKQSPPAG